MEERGQERGEVVFDGGRSGTLAVFQESAEEDGGQGPVTQGCIFLLEDGETLGGFGVLAMEFGSA